MVNGPAGTAPRWPWNRSPGLSPSIRRVGPVAPGWVLLVVERLPVRRGDLLGAGPLCLGEQLLGLEECPGVIVVELGKQVRRMRLALRRPTPATPAPAGIPRRRGRRSGAGGGTRREPSPDRRLLLRQRVVPLLQRLDLISGETELVPVEKDRRNG